MRLRVVFVISCLAFVDSFLLRGQTLSYPVQHLGVGEGLPQGSIYSIFQDKKGFIWLGTGDGLARWDGRSFTTFRGRYGDTSGSVLPARMVRGRMAEDSGRRIWMGTSLGLAWYDQTLHRFHIKQLRRAFDVEHDVIIGLYRHTLLLRSGVGVYGINTLAPSAPEQLLFSIKQQSEVVLCGGTLYQSDSVGILAHDLNDKFAHRILTECGIIALQPFGDDGIQAIKTNELLYLDRVSKTWQRYALLPGMKHDFTVRLATGPASGFGVGPHGFMRFDLAAKRLDSFEVQGDPGRSLSNVLINTVLVDRSRNLWLGTEGTGLDIIDMKGFKFNGWPPRGADGRSRELMVKSLCDVNNQLWIGTFGDGIYLLDRAGGTVRHITGKSQGLNRTSLFFRDSDGRLWMNRDNFIGTVDTITGSFINSVALPGKDNGNQTGYSMLELDKGDFLIGTTFCLARMQITEGRLKVTEIAPGNPATTGIIAALSRYRDGSIFIGKIRDGFYRVRLTNGNLTVLDHGLHFTGIRDFQLAPDGTHLWMATEHGLCYYDPTSRKTVLLDEGSGFSNSHIYGMVPDGPDALWLSTNKGLNRLSFTTDASGILTNTTVRSYKVGDGLQGNEFNTGAFCRLNDGTIAFGGVAGVNWFQPGAVRANPFPPAVAITGISVNEKPLQSDTDDIFRAQLVLPHSRNTLAFKVAALEYTNPEENQYAYKLEGFDQDWVKGGTRAEARYANLPPGHYRFIVKAANSDGIWGDTAGLSIVINPPWWATSFARISAFILALLLLYIAVRLYIRRKIAARLRELEKQQAVNEERLRISRDMHDELGTGLTKIALLSQVAQRKAATGTQPQSLAEISATSRQLTQKIGEIVWTLNPQNDTLDTLASYIREWVQEQYDSLESVLVTTDFEAQIPSVSLSHAKRQALLLVTKEAVNNAVKYSDAREITVRMRLSDEVIRFEVADNGKGFLPGERSKGGSGNGLKNMASRMAAAGGFFQIESAPGTGTKVQYGLAG